MEMEDVRQKLHRFIDSIEDKKAEAMYSLFENEIEEGEEEYTDEFKAELDRRYKDFKSGANMVTAEEAKDRIDKILQARK